MSDVLDDDVSRNEDKSPSEAAALSLALSAAAHHEAVAEKAAHFLDEQTKLVRLQAEDLRKEDAIRHWSLRVRHINDLLKLAFGLSGAILVTAIAIGALALVWSAHEATGLIIQPLKAPPDFSQRGLDGTVLAQRLLDKLNGYVRDAGKWSFRAADNVSGNWGNDSKVEIPDTGISIFELTRFLRQRLGNETSMSGELYRTNNGIALTVRVGANPGTTFEGHEDDVDALLSRAALELLKETQPYRYILALYVQGKPPAKVALVAQELIENAGGTELPWLMANREEMEAFAGEFRQSLEHARATIAVAPSNPTGFIDLAPAEWAIGHLEGALNHIETAERLLTSRSQADLDPSAVVYLIENCRSFAADVRGAYSDAVIADISESKTGTFDFDISGPGSLANDLALDHDIAAASAVLARHPGLSDAVLLQPKYVITTGPDMPFFYLHATAGDWVGARHTIERTDAILGQQSDTKDVRHSLVWPWLAYSLARTRALEAGEELIAKTPLDCTLCLEMRGRLAEESGDLKGAARWYDRASRDAPSLPFSVTDWGVMLLRQGDKDGAIAKFAQAYERSPRYADASELWGEALMQKNRSDLALAKFEEANKYAPHWGRLHLKWGEALAHIGRKDDARAQVDAARSMDLSAADRGALARWEAATHA